MEKDELKRLCELYYLESEGYRKQNFQWAEEVDSILDGTDSSDITKELSKTYGSRSYHEKNARTSLQGNQRINTKDLIRRYKAQMTQNLARFQSSVGKAFVSAASAARGGVAEQYVHNIAGDTVAGDYATEVINDIIANDRTLKKLPRFAGEIFKYNSAILVVKEYGIKGSMFKFNTKLYSGKNVLYDPQSDEEDIQTSRFIGIDGFNYTKDMLERMKMETMADKKGYDMEGIEKILKRIGDGEDEKETEIPMVQMYIYDEDKDEVNHVIFDEEDKVIIKHNIEKSVIAGGREVRFNIVGGIRNSDETTKHYTKSDFYTQIPILKSWVSILIDVLNVVSQVRSNVTLVHPSAFKDVLKAITGGFPVAQGSATSSTGVPIQNQLTTLPQPNLNGLQNVLNQFDEIYGKLFPENTPELRGQVDDKLKSVYEGNVSIIRKIIEANSPLENALRDLYLIIVRVLSQNTSHEFLIRSTSLGGFPLDRILGSKLLKPKKTGGITSVPIDIRQKLGDQTDFIMKKDFIAQLFSSAQEGGVNIRNLSRWIARNANKVQARLTPDDLYCFYTPYDETVVRQVLNDLKMVAVGEKVRYPDGIVGVDYMNTLQECIKQKAPTYIDADGGFNEEGQRVYDFAIQMLEKFARSKAENSEAFQENEITALEDEQRFRQPTASGDELGKTIFANQQTAPEGASL